MRSKIMFLDFDKHNNLLFRVKKQKALFIIDFNQEKIRLIKGHISKSVEKKLRKFMYEHYDLTF